MPGEIPGATHLSPRLRLMADGSLEQRPRKELGALGPALLRNEAQVLARLDGDLAPELIGFEAGAELVLRRRYVPGQRLSDLDPDRWPTLLERFARDLARVHGQGLVHGDLRPDNLIVTDHGLIAIDWEHALPIGAEIAGLPFRATTLGYSDPRLIWAQGHVVADLDEYSILRMLGAEMPVDVGFPATRF